MTMNYQQNAFANSANTYKNQQVMTASPGDLTLLLYNGALRFASETKKAMEAGDYEKAHHSNLKIQKIITELSSSLDRQFELAADWARLYEFITYSLIQANIKRDMAKLNDAIELIRGFRNMWVEVIKATKEQVANE